MITIYLLKKIIVILIKGWLNNQNSEKKNQKKPKNPLIKDGINKNLKASQQAGL